MCLMRCYRLWLILLLCGGVSTAWSTPSINKLHVTALRPNAPAVSGWWYGYASMVSHDLHLYRGCVAIYAVEVWPGLQYTLQVRTPHQLQGIRTYLYDRWPLLPGAHQIALPNGPVVLTPHARFITYRWRFGVSVRSTGNLLYVVVNSPRKPGKRRGYAPRIKLFSPPILPQHGLAHGITYLNGPSHLLLSDDTTPEFYVLQSMPSARHELATVTGSRADDLISNSRFRHGLQAWLPAGVGKSDQKPTVTTEGLRLPATSSVAQELDADVASADSLLLQLNFRLVPATGNVHVARAGRAGLAVDLCYRDRSKHMHCGIKAHRIIFQASRARIPVSPNTDDLGESVPAGKWYHYQVDLMQIKPVPVRIDSLSLLSSGTGATAWVREIHLFLREVDHVSH